MMLHHLLLRAIAAVVAVVLLIGTCPVLGASSAPKADPSKIFSIPRKSYRPILDHIAESEGTAKASDDGYNTSLDYGRWLPDKKEQTLTKLKLEEIDKLQTHMLANTINRARYGNGRGSSALGRYQIVRATVRRLRKQLGLTGSELFDEAMQDRLAAELVRGRGASPSLGQEWASLRGKRLARAIELVREIKP